MLQVGTTQAEESTDTISPSDTYSHFAPSLVPAPLAIAKNHQSRIIKKEGDQSLTSAVEDFKDQIHSAFGDQSQAEERDLDIKAHTPRRDSDSDLDQMISLLPVALHFDISRKPKDPNRHSHRPSVSSYINDQRTVKADDSKSVSSGKSGVSPHSEESHSETPSQGDDLILESRDVERGGYSYADGEAARSTERGASRSGAEDRRGDRSPRTSSVRNLKRPPLTDSDLYTSSLSDKKDIKSHFLRRTPSAGSRRSTRSLGERKSHHYSIHQEDLDQTKLSGPINDESLSKSRGESVSFDLPLVESPAAGETTQLSAEANASAPPTITTNNLPHIASQAASRSLPIRQGLSAHIGFARHPDAPYTRPRSSTAQVSRTSPPFRKPVPFNSLRRSELSSPDFVKYSTDQHHGLKIVLTPESDPKQRHMSSPSLAPPPPPPTRPPPSVPNARNPSATLSPTTSLDITRRWSNESSPTRYMTSGGLSSPIKRDESINDTLSTVSSSERSDVQTLSSAMTSTTNTAATSQLAESVRSQAQNDLQKLQQQLSPAKKRGDSTAQKASLQQSMEIIKKAYLSQSAAKSMELNPDGTTINKPKAIRKKSLSLLTIVGRRPKPGELHTAARTGDNDTLRSLLENKANVNIKGESGRTPLIEAATRSHLHCM